MMGVNLPTVSFLCCCSSRQPIELAVLLTELRLSLLSWGRLTSTCILYTVVSASYSSPYSFPRRVISGNNTIFTDACSRSSSRSETSPLLWLTILDASKKTTLLTSPWSSYSGRGARCITYSARCVRMSTARLTACVRMPRRDAIA